MHIMHIIKIKNRKSKKKLYGDIDIKLNKTENIKKNALFQS
jgi:hypothetical protein